MVMVKIPKEAQVNVEFADFEDYERVRESAQTNMFDAKRVAELSDNLTEDRSGP